MRSVTNRAARRACAGGAALVLTVCCSCGSNSALPAHPGSGKPSGPQFSLSEINNCFSAMSALQPLAARAGDSIAVILPETATAAHFDQVDAPYLKESFQEAGLKTSQYTVWNVPASEQYRAAKAAITHGASVLIVDARYSGAGVHIESYAKAHGVPVIDYDWLTLGGTRSYYVGFDSLKVGVLLGQGLVNCASAWGVKHPQVIVMNGAPTDYNSALYAQGTTRSWPAVFRRLETPEQAAARHLGPARSR